MSKLIIDRLIQCIVHYYAPDRILLFGSHAKGCANPQSDIDLIIIKETTLPRAQRGQDLRASMADIPVKVDLLFLTPTEVAHQLQQEYSFLTSIWKDVQLLFEREG